jgi:DNA processing protein
MPALTDLVALSLLPWFVWRHAAGALRAGEPPDAVLDRCASLLRRPVDPSSVRARAATALERAAQCGIHPLSWHDPAYPSALASIADPPFVLWLRGVSSTLARPAVAIVGSRAASEYGIAVAERLASDLAARGVTVVSGLARGIDAAAHRGALGAVAALSRDITAPRDLVVAGVTIGVLGSGVDVTYPPEHTPLAREIEKQGLIVSELVPGTPPLKPFFPLRNRIISGLVRAVVVVEAGKKSGSLITARLALEQGRDVLAVPGNVLSGRNRGAHALIRDGAKIVESADDILEEVVVPRPGGREVAEDPVLACLTPGEPADLDAIVERSGIAAPRLLPRLFELELEGRVSRAGGGRFVRS